MKASTFGESTQKIISMVPVYLNSDIIPIFFNSINMMHVSYIYMTSGWEGETLCRISITRVCKSSYCTSPSNQVIVALSSTEAKLVTVCDAAKPSLYICKVFEELDLEQVHATIIYEDKNNALLIINTQQTTRCTHHLDMTYISLINWVESISILSQYMPMHMLR